MNKKTLKIYAQQLADKEKEAAIALAQAQHAHQRVQHSGNRWKNTIKSSRTVTKASVGLGVTAPTLSTLLGKHL